MRLFCLGICAYQKYRQFHFLDYLRLMARLQYISTIDAENRANEAAVCSVEAKVYRSNPGAEAACNARANRYFDEHMKVSKS